MCLPPEVEKVSSQDGFNPVDVNGCHLSVRASLLTSGLIVSFFYLEAESHWVVSTLGLSGR